MTKEEKLEEAVVFLVAASEAVDQAHTILRDLDKEDCVEVKLFGGGAIGIVRTSLVLADMIESIHRSQEAA